MIKRKFQSIKHLRSAKAQGQTPADRDKTITQAWQKFALSQVHNPQPFFAFLFYDTAHSYCFKQPFAPLFNDAASVRNRLMFNINTDPIPFLHRYQNALHYIDKLLGQVFASLRQANLLANTIVILTGDHGQEFNDNKLNFWEHGSNYTAYQLQTPLIIYWPQQAAKQVDRRTTHYDIVPTLLHEALGCVNPAAEYSLGFALNNAKLRPYLIAGSYIDYAIVEPGQITTLYTTGDFQMFDSHNHPLVGVQPNSELLQSALQEMRRFYQ